jgi:dUTP pyrophosphatase
MKVKIKKLHSDAVVPRYAKPGDAGLDLTAVSMKLDSSSAGREMVTFGIGLAVEIPEGHVGLLFPRSSVYKSGLTLTNSVGVIDSGYRGEIMMKFQVSSISNMYKVGDRVGQLLIVPYPQVEFEEVDELSSTERGKGGYGSTGA